MMIPCESKHIEVGTVYTVYQICWYYHLKINNRFFSDSYIKHTLYFAGIGSWTIPRFKLSNVSLQLKSLFGGGGGGGVEKRGKELSGYEV